MARLISIGSELNSVTAAMEWDAATGTISTTTVRTGTYAARISSLASGTNKRFRTQFKLAGTNGPFFFRFYLNIATLPSAENRIFALSNNTTAGTGVSAYITVDNGGLLRLYSNAGVVGSASSALSIATWYRIEVLFDSSTASGSQTLRARIDGTEFAASTALTFVNNINELFLGGNLNSEAQTAGDWSFDDVAINDTTGSFQNSYPSSGKLIYLRPTVAGDANGFLTQVGGTAGAANNYTRVNEVTPDDASSYNGSAALNAEDLFKCGASGIGASDQVNVVMVGVRMADITSADATAAFKVEIEKAASGTKTQSAAIIPNSTTWRTNTTAAPEAYPIVLYQDPDGTSWTQATLDTMQIGYIQTATNVQTIAVSNVWAVVDYTPISEVTTTSTSSSTSSTSSSTSSTSSSTSISTTTSSTSSSTSISTSSTSSSTSVSISTSTSSTSTSASTSFSTTTSSTSSSISTSTSLSTSSTSSSTSFSTSTTTSSTSMSTSVSTSTSTSVSTSSSTSISSTSNSTTTILIDYGFISRVKVKYIL